MRALQFRTYGGRRSWSGPRRLIPTRALWAMGATANDGELQAALLEFRVEQDRWDQASPQHRRWIERQILTRARAFLAPWPARR